MATIERAVAPFLVSPDWEPHLSHAQLSAFTRAAGRSANETVWTIVNRTAYDIDGPQMDVPLVAGHALLRPLSRRGIEAGESTGDDVVLSFAIEANGYGAILATPGEPSDAMKSADAAHGGNDAETACLVTRTMPVLCRRHIVEIAPTKPAAEAPEGMVRIPGGTFDFKVQGIEIEGGATPASMCSIRGKIRRGASTSITMQIKPFYIDKYPGDQRAVQEVSRCDALRAEAMQSISARLEERNAILQAGRTGR